MDCVIISEVHNYKGSEIPYDNTYIERPVVIEDNVWLGHGVLILGGVTIGEGAIIQAGAVVVKSIPKLGIAGGNPAVVFSERDAKHYDELKRLGKFH
jgi:acetyltransferase-like isoleucine patch superfamily enzyme